MQITFFTTAGCHLCEQAHDLLLKVANDYNITINLIDIGDDNALIETYGIRIPVLQFSDNEELGWPFDETDIRQRILSKINL